MDRDVNKLFATGVLALALFGAPCTGHLATGADTSAAAQNKVKKAANEVGDKAEDAKDMTVTGAKEVGDKAEDTKDVTVKGGKELGDKAEDGKDVTVKASKKVGHETKEKSGDVAGFFKKMWKKIF